MANGSMKGPAASSRDGLLEGPCSMGEESMARSRQVFSASTEIAGSFCDYPRPLGKVGDRRGAGSDYTAKPGGVPRDPA